MALFTRSRVVLTNQPVVEVVEFVSGADGYTRVQGLNVGDLTRTLTFNGVPMPWFLLSGVGVSDGQVVAGTIYVHESIAGVYTVRFRPTGVGVWHLDLAYEADPQRWLCVYDVFAPPLVSEAGLRATTLPVAC